MFSFLSKLILRLFGWKITGEYPKNISKVVIIVAPHTSNWDFPVGVLVNSAGRFGANYVGKSSLFRWPFGGLFRWLGGIPVDRSKSNNFVAATVEAFKQNPRMHLVISPEGKRARVTQFRTGFYHIARLAEVPICLCVFNWGTREVFFDPKLFSVTGDEKADLEYLWNYYKGIPGANPENGVF
ncbi:MAG: 1-acyl-sn-glycerol-3-phosphate acyltransferase [Bacteroidetes bacterium]|nr:1-acyl-sn-glycerol-3-phosphate acyltransferase [Bacteroidota bacterium]